ncbi:hypothetical protein Salat_2671400 [Sesamum alatum]|uniref:Uncharacterized protein n=1 Tax=Sesamum alatum TaxID=300844 RepID=A0AAE2CB99_9LAMI|nr:hypothetical protein Salat_2671400 [Sesamum alatum]
MRVFFSTSSSSLLPYLLFRSPSSVPSSSVKRLSFLLHESIGVTVVVLGRSSSMFSAASGTILVHVDIGGGSLTLPSRTSSIGFSGIWRRFAVGWGPALSGVDKGKEVLGVAPDRPSRGFSIDEEIYSFDRGLPSAPLAADAGALRRADVLQGLPTVVPPDCDFGFGQGLLSQNAGHEVKGSLSAPRLEEGGQEGHDYPNKLLFENEAVAPNMIVEKARSLGDVAARKHDGAVVTERARQDFHGIRRME